MPSNRRSHRNLSPNGMVRPVPVPPTSNADEGVQHRPVTAPAPKREASAASATSSPQLGGWDRELRFRCASACLGRSTSPNRSIERVQGASFTSETCVRTSAIIDGIFRKDSSKVCQRVECALGVDIVSQGQRPVEKLRISGQVEIDMRGSLGSFPNIPSQHSSLLLAVEFLPAVTGLRMEMAQAAQSDGVRATSPRSLTDILATIDNVVWSIAADTYKTLYLNPAAERIYGRTASAFYADPQLFMNIVHPEDRPRVAQLLPELIEKGAMTIQYRIVRPDGEVRWLEDHGAIARDAGGRPVRFDGVASDITERKAHEANVLYLATHDTLTDLPNRNLLGDRLTQDMAHAQRGGHTASVLVLGLDRFKLINDSYGHGFGDACCGSWRRACAVQFAQATRWQGSGAMNSLFYSPLLATPKRPSLPYAACWTSSPTHSS
jgi:PAS domain S-box-containing protein